MDPKPRESSVSHHPSQATRVIIPVATDTIRTKNLILRPLALSDADDIFEYRRLRTVADWLNPIIPHQNVEETRDCIRQTIFTTPDASGAIGRQFFFAILFAHDPAGSAIGTVGISALSPVPTLEFCTHPSTWNRGIATEAVGALVDAWWKLPRISVNPECPEGPERLFAWCSTSNSGALRVLYNNGFDTYYGMSVSGQELTLFVLEKPQGE